MREYEFTFIVQPEISEEGLETICGKLEAALDRGGATRLFYEDWGRRRLAYEIQKFQKGHYMVLHFLDEGKAIPELERVARLEDSVLRFLTVLADEEVADIETRRAEAVKLEEERKRKAVERAAREAEEAAARAAEAEAARKEAQAAAEAKASEKSGEEEKTEPGGEEKKKESGGDAEASAPAEASSGEGA